MLNRLSINKKDYEEINSIGDGLLTLSEIVRKSDLKRLQDNQDCPLLETFE